MPPSTNTQAPNKRADNNILPASILIGLEIFSIALATALLALTYVDNKLGVLGARHHLYADAYDQVISCTHKNYQDVKFLYHPTYLSASAVLLAIGYVLQIVGFPVTVSFFQSQVMSSLNSGRCQISAYTAKIIEYINSAGSILGYGIHFAFYMSFYNDFGAMSCSNAASSLYRDSCYKYSVMAGILTLFAAVRWFYSMRIIDDYIQQEMDQIAAAELEEIRLMDEAKKYNKQVLGTEQVIARTNKNLYDRGKVAPSLEQFASTEANLLGESKKDQMTQKQLTVNGKKNILVELDGESNLGSQDLEIKGKSSSNGLEKGLQMISEDNKNKRYGGQDYDHYEEMRSSGSGRMKVEVNELPNQLLNNKKDGLEDAANKYIIDTFKQPERDSSNSASLGLEGKDSFLEDKLEVKNEIKSGVKSQKGSEKSKQDMLPDIKIHESSVGFFNQEQHISQLKSKISSKINQNKNSNIVEKTETNGVISYGASQENQNAFKKEKSSIIIDEGAQVKEEAVVIPDFKKKKPEAPSDANQYSYNNPPIKANIMTNSGGSSQHLNLSLNSHCDDQEEKPKTASTKIIQQLQQQSVKMQKEKPPVALAGKRVPQKQELSSDGSSISSTSYMQVPVKNQKMAANLELQKKSQKYIESKVNKKNLSDSSDSSSISIKQQQHKSVKNMASSAVGSRPVSNRRIDLDQSSQDEPPKGMKMFGSKGSLDLEFEKNNNHLIQEDDHQLRQVQKVVSRIEKKGNHMGATGDSENFFSNSNFDEIANQIKNITTEKDLNKASDREANYKFVESREVMVQRCELSDDDEDDSAIYERSEQVPRVIENKGTLNKHTASVTSFANRALQNQDLIQQYEI